MPVENRQMKGITSQRNLSISSAITFFQLSFFINPPIAIRSDWVIFQGHFQPKPFYHSVIMAYLPYHHIPPAHIQDTFIQISLSWANTPINTRRQLCFMYANPKIKKTTPKTASQKQLSVISLATQSTSCYSNIHEKVSTFFPKIH